MHIRRALVLVATCELLCAASARAQSEVRIVNPEALEFVAPDVNQPAPGDNRAPAPPRYLLELFHSLDDTVTATPLASLSVRPDAVGNGIVRVTLSSAMTSGVNNGEYVAVLRAFSSPDVSTRTAASTPFVLSRSGTPDDRAADERHEKRWTRIAILIGAGLLVVPLIF